MPPAIANNLLAAGKSWIVAGVFGLFEQLERDILDKTGNKITYNGVNYVAIMWINAAIFVEKLVY